MLRNIAVLLSALVAMSAQAQDASAPAQASRGPVEPRQPPISPSALPEKPDAGSDATAPEEPNDCGMEQSFFDEDPTDPVAIRFYKSVVAVASPAEDAQHQALEGILPSVWKAGRCGRKYVIQLKSESKAPWPIKDAKLVGPDGEVLKVTRIRSRVTRENARINTITVARTKSVAAPNYRVVNFQLIGVDGRVFEFPSVELP